jgi:hypothetical protein
VYLYSINIAFTHDFQCGDPKNESFCGNSVRIETKAAARASQAVSRLF